MPSSSSSCAIPPANIPYGGHCRLPIASCISPTTPQHELGAHTLHGYTGSEQAFASRYSAPAASPVTAVSSPSSPSSRSSPSSTTAGGGRSGRKPTRRGWGRRSGHSNRNRHARGGTRRAQSRLSRQRRCQRRTHRQKRRGGTGYYLDLTSCPPGGRPSHVQYDSRRPPVFAVNGYPTPEQARAVYANQ